MDFQFESGENGLEETGLKSIVSSLHAADMAQHVHPLQIVPPGLGGVTPVKEPLVIKPTLHVEEPREVFPWSTKAKTPEGGTVYYDYHNDGKPMSAQVYDQDGSYKQTLYEKDVNFPTYKAAVKGQDTLDKLNEEITKLLGPEKPTLHVGEPTNHINPEYGDVTTYKTSSGGQIDYHYTKEGKPVLASEYPTGDYSKPGITHHPEDINFPVHPSFTQKPREPDLPTVHDTYSTAFAYYKNFDDDKPELEFAEPLKESSFGKGLAHGKLENGNKVEIYYSDAGKPYFAKEFDTDGNEFSSYSAKDINLPQHPSEISKPTLHVGAVEPIFGTTFYQGKTEEGGTVYYGYEGGQPFSATVHDKNGDMIGYYTADEVNIPLIPGSKLSLAKVNLSEKYPEEEPEPEYQRHSPLNYPALTLKEPLTDEEKRVASEYSGTYYEDLANHIYYEGSSHVKKQDIETLTKAIDKHPLQSDMTLYRGVSPEVFNKFALLRPGQSGWQTGFMSSRTDRPGARNWKGGKYHFVIETPAGTPALPMETLSRNPGENEILFKPNTKLQMVKKEGRTLYLKIVTPASNEQSLKYYSAYKTRDYTKEEFPWEYREYTEYAKSHFPEAFKSEQDFREKYIDAPLIHLPEDTLKNLENSTVGSYFHAGMEKARKNFSHHRDIDRIEGQMTAGSMPPPIVLKYSGGYRILSGNTRLSVGAAHGYNIPVKLIDISDKY